MLVTYLKWKHKKVHPYFRSSFFSNKLKQKPCSMVYDDNSNAKSLHFNMTTTKQFIANVKSNNNKIFETKPDQTIIIIINIVIITLLFMHQVYNSCCCYYYYNNCLTFIPIQTSIFHLFVTVCCRPGIMIHHMEHAQKMHLIIIIMRLVY